MIVVLAILISNIQLSSTTSCYCTSRDYVIPVFSEYNETEYTPGILMKNECFAGRIQGDLFCPDNQSFCLNQESLYASPCAQVSPDYSYILPQFNSTEYEEELLAIHYEENENRKRFLLQNDDRVWGQWEQWQACIANGCGEIGIRTRHRKCLLKPDGKCPGDNFHLEACLKKCSQSSATDYWSDWSEWSSCAEPCDLIMSNRTRHCNASDTSTCIGDGFEEKPCKVDGSWSKWSSWSHCSINYTDNNGGLTHRLRMCDSPAPTCRGEECIGTSWEILTCAEIHGWTEWTEWSDCIPVAGDELKLRERKCKDDACVDENFEYELCTNETFIIWTLWSPCSVSCDKGLRSRKGYCLIREEFKDFQQENRLPCTNETESCVNNICEGSGMSPWSEWTSWSPCDPPCDDGYSIRTRQCLDKNGCQGLTEETTKCSQSLCKVDGDWSPWEEWNQCRFIQGYNFLVRFRNCTNPPPKNSGKDCSGNNYEIDACRYESTWGEWVSYGNCIKASDGDTTGLQYRNRTCHKGLNKKPCQGNHEEKIQCSLQGKWSRWANWSACSQTCGQGFKHRFRSCINASDLECAGSRMENMTCLDIQNCPIDGSLTEWSLWSQCHVTCGGGLISRNRYCENPRPQYGGKNCEGSLTEASVCNGHNCPVDGHWTDWSEWKPCSVTCGNGTKVRERICSNPIPQYGGKACDGHGANSDICNEAVCDVNGEWGLWQAWTQCTCENNHTRTRNCDNPKPVANGAYCQGKAIQTSSCNPDKSQKCPVNGQWTEWSQWGSVCSVTCGKGTISRMRNCLNSDPLYGGMPCPGEHSESKDCDTIICPTDGGWSTWSVWTSCSVTCENGIQFRNRSCNMPKPAHGGQKCKENPIDTKFCSQKSCPVDGGWSDWESWTSWDVTCAKGSRSRQRKCDSPQPSYGGHNCPGDRNDFDSKDLGKCPVDGGWSAWSSWFGCSVTCGPGTDTRYRACNNPAPQNGGSYCPGSFSDHSSCNQVSCVVDGQWSSWSAWFGCSATCGQGTDHRYRACNNPKPQNGGSYCHGSYSETTACNDAPCIVDGGWSDWGAWEVCSVTCSNGTSVRRRTCDNPQPKDGGKQCAGNSIDVKGCSLRLCPVDGNWGNWTPWSRCMGNCSTANKERFRNCDNPLPENRGKTCEGPPFEMIPCIPPTCATVLTNAVARNVRDTIPYWSPWFYGECSATYGPGTTKRLRHCSTGNDKDCMGPAVEDVACNE